MSVQPAQSAPPPVVAGELLSLAEDEYLYGTGAIRLRVTRVLPSQPTHEWLQVVGNEIFWNGGRAANERTVSIRKDRLPAIRARSNVD
jgi:hypothetical protein